jgi:hypothetical protein
MSDFSHREASAMTTHAPSGGKSAVTILTLTTDHLARPVVVIDATTFDKLDSFRRETWREEHGWGYGESARLEPELYRFNRDGSPAGSMGPHPVGMSLAAIHGIQQGYAAEGLSPTFVREGYVSGSVPLPSLRNVLSDGEHYWFAG